MPLNGSDIASPVPGFNTVASNTTILSSLHNSGINDIFTILNTPRQFAHGALGGTSQITNWDNLTAKGTDIPSASTIVLTTATGPRIDITGVTAITAVTLANGSMRIARATGIFVLTASATLLVNKSASVNYTTAVGDLMIFTAEGGVTSVTIIGSGSSSAAPTSNASFSNVMIGLPTVSGNALTIPITGVDGNVHSATNIGYVNFRSATVGTGAVAQLTVIASNSIVISSGSTLGATNSVAFKGWIVAFNDAGTFRLGVINCTTLVSGVLTQYPLAAFGIASSTAEGGAGAADSAQTFYTGTAVTSKAYTVLGWFSYESGLATVGTYGAAPTRTQTFDASVPLPGRVVQIARQQTGALATGTTVMPNDDTIPQITEGDQYLSQPITPSSASSILGITSHFNVANSLARAALTIALFQDATANALAAINIVGPPNASDPCAIDLGHAIIAGTTISTTFRMRLGSASASTNTINGNGGVRTLGGVASTFLRIEEIAA